MLSEQEVQHIAQLARLRLTPQEAKKYQKDLSLILDYVGQLKKADITGAAPTSHSVAVENVIREDELRPEGTERIKKLVEAAPQREGDYIKVKTIL